MEHGPHPEPGGTTSVPLVFPAAPKGPVTTTTPEAGDRSWRRGETGESVNGSSGESGQVEESSPVRSPKPRLFIAAVLYVFVAVGGAYFTSHPGATPLDRLAERILPDEYSVHWLTYLTDLGRPGLLIPAVLGCCVLVFFWDRRRVVTCLVGPLAAIGIAEYLAKPIVARTYGGSLSFPSGHMASVGAVVACFILAVPPKLRWVAVVLGTAVDVALAAALVLLRWHYLTDVLAGAAIAIATVLVVDTLVHAYPKSIRLLNRDK